MDLFNDARVVHLRSRHHKYLTAEEDGKSVSQRRNVNPRQIRWTVERLDNGRIRLRSCYGHYLFASNEPFYPSLAGCRVIQAPPSHPDDSAIEWEPIKHEGQLWLKTPFDQLLRANGGPPPLRNSVTHDIPNHDFTREWSLWSLDIVETLSGTQAPSSSVPNESEKSGQGVITYIPI